MKGRESGMPEVGLWESFFDAPAVLEKLVLPHTKNGNIVEFGTGYGTFTLALASKVKGTVYGFDIESELINAMLVTASTLQIDNIKAEVRDFLESGTGLGDGAVEHVMLYNILHIEYPQRLLAEAYRILKPMGTLSIMHWRSDIVTPRGPSSDIRPSAAQCRSWAECVGFTFTDAPDISGYCPYHFGLVMRRE